MVVLMVKEEPRAQSTTTPVSQNLPVAQGLGGGQSRSESDLPTSNLPTSSSTLPTSTSDHQASRQSRREIYESTKSKSMSLKSQLKSPFKFLGKTYCGGCKKKCSGEVLRVNDKYFHTQCFKCVECHTSLSTGGFFTKESHYYCTKCYQTNYGTKCAKCNEFVEGEVVSALGNTFHQKCFTCARCKNPFPTGERVTFTGKICLCQKCIHAEKEVDSRLQSDGLNGSRFSDGLPTPASSLAEDTCAGCGHQLKDGQALVALDKQYHIWCFKCTACNVLLHGEYMGHEGKPYCEKDYHEKYGVKCAYCQRFISGKVLQAGDNNHFHPTCARCTKCGDPFGDGEEMYLQGAAIWHPRCGPGPGESGYVINGYGGPGGADTSSMVGDGFDGLSSTMSELHYGGMGSRASSPGGSMLRDYRSQSPGYPHYLHSYIRQGRSVSSLRRPIDPYDRKTSHPPMHFHLPSDKNRKVSTATTRSRSRSGMRTLVDNLQTESPRPRSPYMNNEEAIEMSQHPNAKPEEKETTAPIERDDFPAPPFLYADEARRRRWSEPMKKEEEATVVEPPLNGVMEEKLKTQEATLRKISDGSSMGKVFLDTVKQREKINAQRMAFIDPRSYARTPSATREPHLRLRFDSPVNASPSRLTNSRTDDTDFEHPANFFRSSSGRSLGTPGYSTPGAGSHSTPSYRIISSLGGPPKPGYTSSQRKSATLPSPGHMNGSMSPGFTAFEAGLMGDKTYSADFSSRSDICSEKSFTGVDGGGQGGPVAPKIVGGQRGDIRASTTYTQGLRNISTGSQGGRSYSAHMNRSLPNMTAALPRAPKIYPIHLLITSNYRLPNDADRCNLERHLSDADFELIFEISRSDFYRLPTWKRSDLKKRVKLF